MEKTTTTMVNLIEFQTEENTLLSNLFYDSVNEFYNNLLFVRYVYFFMSWDTSNKLDSDMYNVKFGKTITRENKRYSPLW